MSKFVDTGWTEARMVARAQEIVGRLHILIAERYKLREQIVEVMRQVANDHGKIIADLQKRIDYYEQETPMGKGNCYHKFTDEGICIRCMEDAENWDAGCVEEIVEDLKSVAEPEFIDALTLLIEDKSGGPIDTVNKYLTRLEYFAAGFKFEPEAEVATVDSFDDDNWELEL